MSDYTEITKLLKRASPFDAFLLSFLALPFIVQAWLAAFEKMAFSQCVQNWSVAAVVVVYAIGAISVVLANTSQRRSEVAKDRITAYLQSKDLSFASFERIRERVSSEYTNDFLEKLPRLFPQEVRCAKLKSGKRGIGRVLQEKTDDA